MAIKKRRRAATSPIDKANDKSDAEFIKDYLEPEVPGLTPWRKEWTHPKSGQKYRLSLARPAELGDEDLEACYRLIEETSRADYEGSAMKWRPEHKRKEMRSPELRYIIVREEATAETPAEVPAKPPAEVPASSDIDSIQENVIREKGPDNNNSAGNEDAETTTTPSLPSIASTIRAFTSLMPVYEEGEPVVYCYEIHLSPSLQGSGLGHLLLGFQSIVAHNLGPPVSKVMLTCFLSNARALKFYERQGFVTDPLAPTTRRLRGGKMFVPDYTILSKPVVR
ncbi:N alpha-acetyl-transferase [Sporothrix bragantina]|uniref:N-alpha-acetyltransferase 40 n=1 Tax=Sporothrix bragantina TaxID=671064 RepID=A0ABP0BP94_9PEZI